MPSFTDICTSDIRALFVNTSLNPVGTFLSGSGASATFNSTRWSNISGANAFPRVMDSSTTATTVTSQPLSVRVTAGTPPTTQTRNLRIFSVLEYFKEQAVNSQRYADPADTFYWNSKGVTDLTSTDSRLSTLYTSLKAKDVPGATPARKIIQSMTPLTSSNAEARYSVSLDLLYSIKYEYCYWGFVLQSLLGDLFTVQAARSQSSTSVSATERKVMNAAASVNLRLNDLSQIITYISNQQETELQTTIDSANEYVTDIASSQGTINKALDELTSKDGLTKLRSRMVEYNEEKNNFASSLLSIYGFANLIAIGLLFYIYKS